jgi:dTDP-6-deoxy-L-talose 4-dehydrogenase (NAD+)
LADLSEIPIESQRLPADAPLRAAFSRYRPSTIVHCAAYGVDPAQQNSADCFAVNVAGSLSLLRSAAAHGVTRFINIGSCFEYASSENALTEESPLAPGTPYSSSKAALSLLLPHYAQAAGIEALTLRLFGLWGPYEAAYRLVSQLIETSFTKKPLPLTDGTQVRDFTFVRDMAEWIASLCFEPYAFQSQVINLGSGHAQSVRDFATSIARELGCETLLQFGAKPRREGEAASLFADVSKRDALLGPVRTTPVGDALRETLAAYRHSKSANPVL